MSTREGPAAAAGKREVRHPGEKELARAGEEGDTSKQRFAPAADVPEAPAGASAEVGEVIEEASEAQKRPYEPQSTKQAPH